MQEQNEKKPKQKNFFNLKLSIRLVFQFQITISYSIYIKIYNLKSNFKRNLHIKIELF